MLLAIDTATHYISIALYDGKNLLAERTWQSYNHHTVQLAPAVFHMLDQCDLDIDAVTALGVSIGPGSYTGLRIGVSLAKGIAAARELPLVGVTTFEIVAAAQPYYQAGGLVVVVQAGRSRIIVKTYRWRKGQWGGRGEPLLTDWQGLLAHIDGPAYITGEIDDDGMATLTEAQANNTPITIVPGAHRLRRAGFLAQVAWEMLNTATDKRQFAPGRVLPIYLKTDDKDDKDKDDKEEKAADETPSDEAIIPTTTTETLKVPLPTSNQTPEAADTPIHTSAPSENPVE